MLTPGLKQMVLQVQTKHKIHEDADNNENNIIPKLAHTEILGYPYTHLPEDLSKQNM